MSRIKPLKHALMVCAAVAVAAATAMAILHARGLSFHLTETYFIVGPAHAQQTMSSMANPAAAPSTS